MILFSPQWMWYHKSTRPDWIVPIALGRPFVNTFDKVKARSNDVLKEIGKGFEG